MKSFASLLMKFLDRFLLHNYRNDFDNKAQPLFSLCNRTVNLYDKIHKNTLVKFIL